MDDAGYADGDARPGGHQPLGDTTEQHADSSGGSDVSSNVMERLTAAMATLLAGVGDGVEGGSVGGGSLIQCARSASLACPARRR